MIPSCDDLRSTLAFAFDVASWTRFWKFGQRERGYRRRRRICLRGVYDFVIRFRNLERNIR